MDPEKIIEAFGRRYGQKPGIVVRAPGRINLIGEHTDYNEGLVLPAAIDKAIWFAVGPREDNRIELFAYDLQEAWSTDLLHLAPSGKGWPDYLLGVFYVLQGNGFRPEGCNVLFGGDIPIGAGLSSSAALETGMLAALNHLFHLGLFKQDVVKMAQRAENEFVGMQCGVMDMFAAVMGRESRVICLDCRSMEFDYFPFADDTHCLVLCNSGVRHQLVDSEYNSRRAECDEAVHLLQERIPGIYSLRDVTAEMLASCVDWMPDLLYKRSLFVVSENTRVEQACAALDEGNMEALGALLYASHEGLRDLYEVSCSELDFLVEQARMHPAVAGARMMGGGFGGCTLNIVHKDGREDFIRHMQAAYSGAMGRELECYTVQLSEGVGEWE